MQSFTDLHMNITEGVPVGKGPYHMLVNDKGFMHGKDKIRELHNRGKIDLREVCFI